MLHYYTLISVGFLVLSALIGFSFSINLSIIQFRKVIYKKPKPLIVGILLHVFFDVLYGYIMLVVLDLNFVRSLGILLICTAPCSLVGCLMTWLVKGDIALSFTMVGVTSILAFGSIPLFDVILYDTQFSDITIDINFMAIFIYCIIVFIPISIGLFIGSRLGLDKDNLEKLSFILGITSTIFYIVWLIITFVEESEAFENASAEYWIGFSLPMFSMALAYTISGFFDVRPKIARTLACTCSSHNITIVLSTIGKTFEQNDLRDSAIVTTVIFLLSYMCISLLFILITNIFLLNENIVETETAPNSPKNSKARLSRMQTTNLSTYSRDSRIQGSQDDLDIDVEDEVEIDSDAEL